MKPVKLVPTRVVFSSTHRGKPSYKQASSVVYVGLKYGFLLAILTPLKINLLKNHSSVDS